MNFKEGVLCILNPDYELRDLLDVVLFLKKCIWVVSQIVYNHVA